MKIKITQAISVLSILLLALNPAMGTPELSDSLSLKNVNVSASAAKLILIPGNNHSNAFLPVTMGTKKVEDSEYTNVPYGEPVAGTTNFGTLSTDIKATVDRNNVKTEIIIKHKENNNVIFGNISILAKKDDKTELYQKSIVFTGGYNFVDNDDNTIKDIFFQLVKGNTKNDDRVRLEFESPYSLPNTSDNRFVFEVNPHTGQVGNVGIYVTENGTGEKLRFGLIGNPTSNLVSASVKYTDVAFADGAFSKDFEGVIEYNLTSDSYKITAKSNISFTAGGGGPAIVFNSPVSISYSEEQGFTIMIDNLLGLLAGLIFFSW